MTGITKKQSLGNLHQAREILAELPKTKADHLKNQWEKAAECLGKAGVWIDQSDTRRDDVFDYKGKASKAIGKIDKLAEFINAGDSRHATKYEAQLNEIFKDGIISLGRQEPVSPLSKCLSHLQGIFRGHDSR